MYGRIYSTGSLWCTGCDLVIHCLWWTCWQLFIFVQWIRSIIVENWRKKLSNCITMIIFEQKQHHHNTFTHNRMTFRQSATFNCKRIQKRSTDALISQSFYNHNYFTILRIFRHDVFSLRPVVSSMLTILLAELFSLLMTISHILNIMILV